MIKFEPFADKLVRTIAPAAEMYHRLIVLVAPAGSGKTDALREVHDRTGAPLVNINLELSRCMLGLTERQRVLQVQRLLSEIVNAFPSEVVLLDNFELLFDISLKQDPLRLLQSLSRNKTVVASWNGSLEKDQITYATPDHPEHRRYPLRDFLVVSPESTA